MLARLITEKTKTPKALRSPTQAQTMTSTSMAVAVEAVKSLQDGHLGTQIP